MASTGRHPAHQLDSQVGGHAGGMQETEDGSLIIKTSYPAERAFYQAVATDDTLAPLRDHIPEFIGILTETSNINGSPLDILKAPTGKDTFIPWPSGLRWLRLIFSISNTVACTQECVPLIHKAEYT